MLFSPFKRVVARETKDCESQKHQFGSLHGFIGNRWSYRDLVWKGNHLVKHMIV